RACASHPATAPRGPASVRPDCGFAAPAGAAAGLRRGGCRWRPPAPDPASSAVAFPGAGRALALDLGALALAGQAALLGGAGGPGGDARLRRAQHVAHHLAQALARVLAVALLGAEALGVDDQHALVGEAAVTARQQALLEPFRQRARVGHVEAE